MNNGVLSQLSFRQQRNTPFFVRCAVIFFHKSLHNTHPPLFIFHDFLTLFYSLVDSPHLFIHLFNTSFVFMILWIQLSSLKMGFTIILNLHILVDSPLSRFLEILIYLICLLVYLLGLVVHHQVHLAQVLH